MRCVLCGVERGHTNDCPILRRAAEGQLSVQESTAARALHHYEWRNRLVHCDLCGVRTYCRVLDGVKICPDRCWPRTQVECGLLMEEINWWTAWCRS